MGGEPNVHPNFGRRYSIAQHYFEKVMLFTNALNDQVMLIEPRSNDTINYIFRFIFTKTNATKYFLIPQSS